jgi:nucleotidyltransferase substrate binding protein (TIGR01987 family)
MERQKQRLAITEKAQLAFREVLQLPVTQIIRDAAIQRFEFTTEATWKLLQIYLHTQEGLDVNSPKSVFRAAFQVGLLNEDETSLALEMIDMRNLTVHTYNEALAQQIFSRLPEYADLMEKLLIRMKNKIP